MIEIIVGLVLCTLITVGVNIYMRWFVREGPRNEEFERWCRSAPVVAAFRVHDEDGQRALIESLRHLLAGGEFSNKAGRFPWQHYFVRFEWRRLEGGHVGIVVAGCVRERIRQKRPDLSEAFARLGPVAEPVVEELWVHGELYGDGRFERAKMGWIGRFAPGGAFDVQPMIGQPAWLAGTARAA